MANYKPIVIDVKEKSTPQGVEQEWVDVTTHMPILTRDIKTPALDKNSDLTSVVSGMPTVLLVPIFLNWLLIMLMLQIKTKLMLTDC